MSEVELERMVVRLVGDGSSYAKMLGQAQALTKQVAGSVLDHGRAIEKMQQRIEGHANTVKTVIASVAGAVGIAGVFGTLQNAIERFGQQEQLEIAFETLVGDVGKARKALADLTKFAAETPFELPELMEAAKSALAFGQEIETIVPTMRMLGDISAGLNIPIGQLTYLFGTLKSQGRAFTVDINQFAMRGIPIWQELERITGKTNAEVRKMVEQGQVGFPIVEQAFKNMVGAGGKFGGLMEKQSKSLLGLWSTLKDSIGQILTDLGKEFSENVGMKGVIDDVGKLAASFGDWIKSLPASTKKAALAIAVVTVAVGALTAAAIALGIAITYASGGLNLFAVALAAISGVSVAGLSGIVISLGGVAEAWGLVKRKALEAWEWLLPVRRAVTSFFNEVEKQAVENWRRIERFATETWDRINNFLRARGLGIDWGKVRLNAVEFFIFMEYSLGHLAEAWELMRVGAVYALVVVGEEAKHLLTTVIPAAHQWLSKVFPQLTGVMLSHAFRLWVQWQTNLAALVIGGAVRIRNAQREILFAALTQGPGAIAAMGARMKEEIRGFLHGFRQGEFEDMVVPDLVIPDRQVGALEEHWKREWEKAKGVFNAGGFEEFRKRKLAEFFAADPETQQKVIDEATKTGDKVADQLKKMTKEAEKFDQAVYGSAEALQRLQHWRDRQARVEKAVGAAGGPLVAPVGNGAGLGLGAVGGGLAMGVTGGGGGSAGGGAANANSPVPLLKVVVNELVAIKMNTKPGAGMVAADLEG